MHFVKVQRLYQLSGLLQPDWFGPLLESWMGGF